MGRGGQRSHRRTGERRTITAEYRKVAYALPPERVNRNSLPLTIANMVITVLPFLVRVARYVRLQLAEPGFLHSRECKVYGH